MYPRCLLTERRRETTTEIVRDSARTPECATPCRTHCPLCARESNTKNRTKYTRSQPAPRTSSAAVAITAIKQRQEHLETGVLLAGSRKKGTAQFHDIAAGAAGIAVFQSMAAGGCAAVDAGIACWVVGVVPGAALSCQPAFAVTGSELVRPANSGGFQLILPSSTSPLCTVCCLTPARSQRFAESMTPFCASSFPC